MVAAGRSSFLDRWADPSLPDAIPAHVKTRVADGDVADLDALAGAIPAMTDTERAEIIRAGYVSLTALAARKAALDAHTRRIVAERNTVCIRLALAGETQQALAKAVGISGAAMGFAIGSAESERDKARTKALPA